MQNPTDSTELVSSSSFDPLALPPSAENDPTTFPVAVLMSLAQPSTEPVSTREPSLLHARQVSAPLCPS